MHQRVLQQGLGNPYPGQSVLSTQVGHSHSQNIGHMILMIVTVPVFDALGKTFSLEKETLYDLGGTGGPSRFKGKILSGLIALVGTQAVGGVQLKDKAPISDST